MPNIALALREEMSRIARREVRSQTGVLQRSSAKQRREIAKLKREIANLTRALKQSSRTKVAEPASLDDSKKYRFVASGFRTLRHRLGLSAAQMGKLIGVSEQSIYNWETKSPFLDAPCCRTSPHFVARANAKWRPCSADTSDSHPEKLSLFDPVTWKRLLELLHGQGHRLSAFDHTLNDVRREERSPNDACDVTLGNAFRLADRSEGRVLSAGDLPIPLAALCNELEQRQVPLSCLRFARRCRNHEPYIVRSPMQPYWIADLDRLLGRIDAPMICASSVEVRTMSSCLSE